MVLHKKIKQAESFDEEEFSQTRLRVPGSTTARLAVSEAQNVLAVLTANVEYLSAQASTSPQLASDLFESMDRLRQLMSVVAQLLEPGF